MGGGIGALGSNTIYVSDSTVAFNEASDGANVGLLGASVSIWNTIVSNPLGGDNCLTVSATITSVGSNVADDASCALASVGDQQDVDPLLGPLQANGGPTFTHAPAIMSPAIDQGFSVVNTDQRGAPRPVDLPGVPNGLGDARDVGAYEVQAYEGAVLETDPAGYWRFGDPQGTFMLDSSGNNNHGTYIGGVKLGQPGALVGDPNTAALYDGIDDQGRVPDSATMDVGNTFTAEGWIKRTANSKTYELMNKGASGIHLVVMSGASGNKVILRRANVAAIAQSTVGVPLDANYHHIVATMNGLGSTARIYIDGNDVTQTVSPGQTILNTAFPMTFGSFGSAPSTPGNYDEFALYDEALPGCEVQDHYTAGTGAPYIGC